MDIERLKRELGEVLARHEIVLAVIGTLAIEDSSLVSWGRTFIRTSPKDHEEMLLREQAAKEASNLIGRVARNTYPELFKEGE